MPLLIVVIGAILLISAIQNTYKQLFSDLAQDGPGFLKWALALIAVGCLQFIPGFQPVGRAFLGLVVLGLFFANRQAILQGFQNVGQGAAAPVQSPDVAQQFSAAFKGQTSAPTKPILPQADVYGIAAPAGMAWGGGATNVPATNTNVGGGGNLSLPPTFGIGVLPQLPSFKI